MFDPTLYRPTIEEVRELARGGNLIPICREVVADLETPVSAFLKIARGRYSYLLESVEGGERLARYSFLGTDPYLVIQSPEPKTRRYGASAGRDLGSNGVVRTDDPLRQVEAELARWQPVTIEGLPRFPGGAVGYLSYEVARHFERLPSPEADPQGLPEAVFMFTDTTVVFDHLKHRIKVIGHVRAEGDIDQAYAEAVARIERLVKRLGSNGGRASAISRRLGQSPVRNGSNGAGTTEFASSVGQSQFEKMVRRAKEYIEAGDIIQVVLSQRLSRVTTASPLAIYRALRAVNPSPYMYFLQLGSFDIVGASPELLVRVEDGLVETHPIAGTRPRGRDAEEDLRLEHELRADEKERAEHVMLVDLGRNDIGRVSQPGTVQVTQLLDVERFSHVMHLVSHVTGQLQPNTSSLDALRACFPAGTVSGAPKIRAMEIIAELELDRRGPYAGSVGYIAYSGNLDTAITIRTIVLKDQVAYVQAGAGIVADSVPEREHQECLNKARALLRAIEDAERLGQ